ncbi:sugar phosphate isomerase/epimerase family protein [Jiangella asiatica]|uniref:Sugar phosphate isomerase/epimerase n=1 Tax=Jiangella asiatica TaxID=2530372 RepID=A0A4R5CLR0_9ACTN|nr:sugar phosphate isomerase/epimerase family protein [Jiangella asiatica]TDE00207.1 sugar phosphate isomerase/epimerase [Jiangella asiatica]
MNPLALHAMVFLRGGGPAAWERVVSATATAGFDLLEVPLRDPSAVDAPGLRTLLDDAGLGAVGLLAMPFDADVSSPDEAVAARGARLLDDALAVATSLGSPYLGGVLYGAAGRHDGPATTDDRRRSVAALRRLAGRAAAADVTIGLEVVNRYESNLINTASQALDLIDEIGADNVGVHLDTFHMNIEEADVAAAIRACGDRLVYVHASESNRGHLGRGSVDFDAVFGTLADVGYGGPVGFESFTAAAAPDALRRSMALWRDVWSDPDDLAAHARAFISGAIERATARG